MCFAGGLIMTLLGLLATPWVLRVTKTPEDIMALSLTYLRIFFVSMVPMFMYNMTSSIMRAVGNAKAPL